MLIVNGENVNQILKVEYIGLSTSMIHGKAGYFFVFIGKNERKIGKVYLSDKDYDIFSNFIKCFKLKGFNLGLKFNTE